MLLLLRILLGLILTVTSLQGQGMYSKETTCTVNNLADVLNYKKVHDAHCMFQGFSMH